jgi:hypothetical protein
VFLESSSIFHADPALSTDGVAYGEGVEREVMTTIFTRFTASEAQWFERGEDNYLILRTLFSVGSPIPIPERRLALCKRLGALCGLLLIFGQLPTAMSPALFQYLIHDGNFHSLNPSFIGEWFPALRALILAWLALDPEDQDLSAFQAHCITFHNIEASLLLLCCSPFSLVSPGYSF